MLQSYQHDPPPATVSGFVGVLDDFQIFLSLPYPYIGRMVDGYPFATARPLSCGTVVFAGRVSTAAAPIVSMQISDNHDDRHLREDRMEVLSVRNRQTKF